MKAFYALMLFLVLSLAASGSFAQEVFIKKQDPIVPQELLKSDPDLAPKPSNESSRDLANRYYKNCKKAESPTMSDSTQDLFCACTAAKMTENMTVEEIRQMYERTPEGEKQRTRMTAYVYVPCMEFPVHDLIRKNCTNNPEIKKNFKKYRAVCSCLAQNMSRYSAQTSTRLIEEKIRQTGKADPDISALLNDLMESKEYSLKSQEYVTTCVRRHEFGL